VDFDFDFLLMLLDLLVDLRLRDFARLEIDFREDGLFLLEDLELGFDVTFELIDFFDFDDNDWDLLDLERGFSFPSALFFASAPPPNRTDMDEPANPDCGHSSAFGNWRFGE